MMDSRATLDAQTVRREIDALRSAFPYAFSDSDEAFLSDLIEGETGLFEVLQRLDDILADADMTARAISDRRAALSDRQDRYECKAGAVRSLMQSLLTASGLSKVTLPTATIFVRATPPKVAIIDDAEIPAEFTRTKVEPDKPAILAALKAGADVPGAALTNGGQSLTIRRS